MIAQGGEGDWLRGLLWNAHTHWVSRTPTRRVAAAQSDAAECRISGNDDPPYVVPPLEISFTVRVRVKDIGELPVMSYPINDFDVASGDG